MSFQIYLLILIHLITFLSQTENKKETTLLQVIEELQGQHELAMEKITQLESIITQQSVDMVSRNIGSIILCLQFLHVQVSKNKRSNAQIERIFTRQQCTEDKTRKGRAAVQTLGILPWKFSKLKGSPLSKIGLNCFLDLLPQTFVPKMNCSCEVSQIN